MHDAQMLGTDESLGSVFVRTAELVTTLYPKKNIEYVDVHTLEPYPEYDAEFTPSDDVMRRCYRNQYAGSFPVIRENGTILNGHKRIEACKAAGRDNHPVEVVNVTDEQADELFRLAHREYFVPEETDG